MLTTLFSRRSARKAVARDLYAAVVTQARLPWLFQTCRVDDTVDGRFDSIVLHVVLVFRRLQHCDGDGKTIAQDLWNEMMTDLDRNLREMGVGDLSVSKKIKGMAKAIYGRIGVYHDALETGDEHALHGALLRNVYRFPDDDQTPPAALDAVAGLLTRYVLAQVAALRAAEDEDFRGGKIPFIDPVQAAIR